MVEPDGNALEPHEDGPSYSRELKRQLLVNSTQVEELQVVLRWQRARLVLLSALILLLGLVIPTSLYFDFRDQDLIATGVVNASVVFALFAICKTIPVWRSAFGVVWRTECLIAMQNQAIHLAEHELEGGAVAAE